MSLNRLDHDIVEKLYLYDKPLLATRYQMDPEIREFVRGAFRKKRLPLVYSVSPFGMSINLPKISDDARVTYPLNVCARAFKDEEICKLLLYLQKMGGGTFLDIWEEIVHMKRNDVKNRLRVLRYKSGFRYVDGKTRIECEDIPTFLKRYSSRPEWYDQPPVNAYSFEREGLKDWFLRNKVAGEVTKVGVKTLCRIIQTGGDVEVVLPDPSEPLTEDRINYSDRKFILMSDEQCNLVSGEDSTVVEPLEVIRKLYENLQLYLTNAYEQLNPVISGRVKIQFNEFKTRQVLEDIRSWRRRL